MSVLLKRIYGVFLMLCMSLSQLMAAAIPAEYVGDGKWVTLKTENGYYFYAIEEGGQINLGQTKTAPNVQNYADYCWQIEGNETNGYTFRCLKYENADGSVTPEANRRYITNPATLATNGQEVLLTNTPSYYNYTSNRQLQLVANTGLYLAFYSSSYSTIRLHNSADYIGSRMVIGGIFDWSVAAVVYGTEVEGPDGIPQGTYLANGGVTYGGTNYLHGQSLTLSDEALSNLSLVSISGYRTSTIKIDRDNRYIVAYYVGEGTYTYRNADTNLTSETVVTGADNTIWSLNAVNYITNTSGNFNNVPAGKAWQMEMIVQNTNASGNDPSFNRWGSCVLSSNGDPLNTYYWGDFQVYQHAPTHASPNTLNFKSSKADGNDHIIAQGASVANRNYKVIVRYNGNNIYIIRTIMLDADLQETDEVYNNVWVSARQQVAIGQMSCALPTGINLKSLRISIAEESNLLEDVDYAIQNIATKDYLTGKSAGSDASWRTPYGGEAAKYQIKWTGIADLTYSETDGGLHNSFYIKLIDHAGNAKWLGANNVNVDDMANAQAFVYTTSLHVAPITTKDQISESWGVGENKAWFWDFFANFYVEVAGNSNGGLNYHRNSAIQTATNGQYIELPSGVSIDQMSNSSQAGYMAAISKQDIRLKVQYTPLENTFYTITSKTSQTAALYYWNTTTRRLVTYSTTNSQSGQYEAWNKVESNETTNLFGDCSKFTITKVTTIPVKMNAGGDGKYYGSIYCPNALTLPEGVTAYTLKDILANGNYLLHALEGVNPLPANTAVVLISDADLSGNWSVNPNGATALAGEDNHLEGCYEDIPNPGINQQPESSVYMLSGGGKDSQGQSITGIGFYLYKGTNIPAFKAYHQTATESAPVRYTFQLENDGPGISTGIEELNPSSPFKGDREGLSGLYYDVLGRATAQPQKGHLYIHNGQKIMY